MVSTTAALPVCPMIFADSLGSNTKSYNCSISKGRSRQMLARICQRECPMSQAQHTAAMGSLTCQQCRSTWRARRSSAKSPSKKYSLVGQLLYSRSRDGMSVRLNIATSIVRMNVNDVRFYDKASQLGQSVEKNTNRL